MIKDGVEVYDTTFPFETGDQIWGSISSADIDLDGYLDFAVASKSSHLYLFDINGLKFDYNAGRWLIATPVIGNIDNDDELEIVIGGYESPTSSSPLFAINHDGTDVDGFPYSVGEKMKAGVAIADMDGNGIEDIVFGTDGDNLYVLLDDLTIAPGFPLDLGNNLRSEPAVLNAPDEKVILIGCNDNNFYGINYSDASLRFVIPTGDDVLTSAAFKEGINGTEIYFGSDDGNIYGINTLGENLTGFPLNIDGGIVGSIVFSDIYNDNSEDMIAVNDNGQIYAFNEDNSLHDHFPIEHQFSFSSAPLVVDYDNDNDLEIICGSAADLVIVDYKDNTTNNQDSWNVYKGDYQRTGYYSSSSEGWEDCLSPVSGDVNCDSIINVLDIVTVVNIVIIGSDGRTDYQLWSSDVNLDGIINVLDIVVLVNIVING